MTDIFVDAPEVPGQPYVPDWGRILTRVLFVVAFLVVVATPFGAVSPNSCMDKGLEREATAEAVTSWSRQDVTLWPPGQRCVLTLGTGETVTVEEHSWLPVAGVGIASLATVTALARRRQRGMSADLELVRSLVEHDSGLAVVATTRADGSVQTSVVNAGVLVHPVDGSETVGLVARGDALKVRNLRARPRAAVVFRAGWNWASVEGPVELAGPNDELDGVDGERLRLLLREIFTAAGGTHHDFEEYDRVMAAEGRTAVLVRPERVSTNRG